MFPAENSGKISAARQLVTTSRYHSSRPGPPPHELFTTSGAKSTRAFPSESVGAKMYCAAANKSTSEPPAAVNALTERNLAPGATPTWLEPSVSLPTIVPVT